MRIVVSVPSGFHLRELLLPLQPWLEQDPTISSIVCICPAADYRDQLFPTFGSKFEFLPNPATPEDHAKLLQKVAPDLVITTTAGLDPLDLPLLEAAQRLQIKTFTFIASWDNVWKMERLKRQHRPQVVADHLAVWNDTMRDHLLRIFPDLPAEHVTVLGAPRLDYFWQADRIPSEAALRERLGLPLDDKALIHIATTELYPSDYLLKTMYEAAQQGQLTQGIHMYVSVHPGGNLDKHKAYSEPYGAHVRYSFGRRDSSPHPNFLYNPSPEDIYLLVALFKYTAVLVNHSSTVAIESMAADVPIINVKYGKPLDWWRWYRSMVYRDFQQHYRDITDGHGTDIVKNPRQLIGALNRYLEHPEDKRPERQATLTKMITTTDGTASKKMFDLIKTQR
jgi:hypothetical protein